MQVNESFKNSSDLIYIGGTIEEQCYQRYMEYDVLFQKTIKKAITDRQIIKITSKEFLSNINYFRYLCDHDDEPQATKILETILKKLTKGKLKYWLQDRSIISIGKLFSPIEYSVIFDKISTTKQLLASLKKSHYSVIEYFSDNYYDPYYNVSTRNRHRLKTYSCIEIVKEILIYNDSDLTKGLLLYFIKNKYITDKNLINLLYYTINKKNNNTNTFVEILQAFILRDKKTFQKRYLNASFS